MQTLNVPATLKGAHLRTYEKIFLHPTAHNLAWRDVLALFNHLGEVTTETNGNLKVTYNGHVYILPPPSTKEVATVEEMQKLRQILEPAQTLPSSAEESVPHLLVVINRHQVRLFRSELPDAQPQVILLHESGESLRHSHDGRDFFSGKGKPVPSDYFEAVAKALKTAEQILVFGAGTANSSEMDQLLAWLEGHHPALARRIVGTLVVDEHHLTGPQLLAMARNFHRLPRR